MAVLTTLLSALTRTLEMEGRVLRRGLVKLLIGCVLLTVGLGLFLAGFGYAMYGLYIAIAPATGAPGAAFIVAGSCLVAAVIMVGATKWLTR